MTRLTLAALLLPLFAACNPLSVNLGTFSGGLLLDGCRVLVGYYDSGRQVGDSGEWKLCR